MMKKELPKNLIEMLDFSATANPEKISMHFIDKKVTYRELACASDCFAQGLENLGVEKDNKVAIFLPNSPEFVIAYFGIIKTGSIVVPINNMFKQEETEFILKDAGVCVVITSLVFLDMIRSIKKKTKNLKYIILVDGITPDTLNFYEIIERTAPKPKPEGVEGDSIASILYTSGTTGQTSM